MARQKLGPNDLVHLAVPPVVRSDGLFRLNLTLASAHATNAYALFLLNPDIVPYPVSKRLKEAAELLQVVEENVEYLFNQRRMEQMSKLSKLKKGKRRML